MPKKVSRFPQKCLDFCNILTIKTKKALRNSQNFPLRGFLERGCLHHQSLTFAQLSQFIFMFFLDYHHTSDAVQRWSGDQRWTQARAATQARESFYQNPKPLALLRLNYDDTQILFVHRVKLCKHFVYFCNKLCGTTHGDFLHFLCTSATSYVELRTAIFWHFFWYYLQKFWYFFFRDKSFGTFYFGTFLKVECFTE